MALIEWGKSKGNLSSGNKGYPCAQAEKGAKRPKGPIRKGNVGRKKPNIVKKGVDRTKKGSANYFPSRGCGEGDHQN